LKAPETGVSGAFFWVPLQLIGSSIVPSSLVTQVPGFPVPRSSGCAGLASPGCPAAASSSASGCASPRLPWAVRSSAVPAMRLRVASRLASFSAAGGNSPGRPESSLHHASPPGVSAGLPRFPHLPAVPAMEPRVAPRFPSFSAAVGGILRVAPCPLSFSCASRCFRRVAPASTPSGCASDGASGCPASRILRRCR